MPYLFTNWRWRQIAGGGGLLLLFMLALMGIKKMQALLPALPACWFHRLSGLPCPTCGATRATLAFAHGHWLAALQWNPLITLTYAAIILGGMMMILLALSNRRLHGPRLDAVLTKARWWLLAAVTANWCYLLVRD